MNKDIPTLICHACEYDMHDRKVSEPCPECGTPLDTRPDGYTKPLKLMVPMVCSILTILVMPFISIFSFVFMIPSFLIASSQKRISPEYRIPIWAQKRLKQNRILIWIAYIEFWATLIWPQVFNWWW